MLSSERYFQISSIFSSDRLKSDSVPDPESNSSIIAFVNPKSGGLKGKYVYEKFKNYLSEKNVFDLSQCTPDQGYYFLIDFP
jgi:hypothetical protein